MRRATGKGLINGRGLRGAVLGVVAVAALVVLWPGSGAPATSDAPQLRGEWHLDEGARCGDDSTGSTPAAVGPDLALLGPGPCLVPGRFGMAFQFPAEWAWTGGTALQPEQLTVLAWVEANGSPGPSRYVLADGSGGKGECIPAAYGMYTSFAGGANEGGLEFYVNNGGGAYSAPGVPAGRIWDGKWHMVAGTFDGATARFYLDGREVGNGIAVPGPIDYALPTDYFTVGGYGGPRNSSCSPIETRFAGSIDEVRVYDGALGADDLQRLADYEGSDPPPPLVEPPPPPPSTTPSTTPTTTPTTTTSTTPTTTTPTTPTSPPSGQAPQVADVGTAQAIAPGGPAVLTARVVGSLSDLLRLEWDLNGDGKPEIVGSASQTSLRFRPPEGRFTVAVRAVGPGGPGQWVSKTFVSPAAPGDRLVRLLRPKLLRRPAVYAVGPGDRLVTGAGAKILRTCLAPTTIRSGGLDITGCFVPIDSLGDVPNAERDVVRRLASRLSIGTDPTTLDTAVKLSDAYRAISDVNVNGVTLGPSGGASIVVYAQAYAIASSSARARIGTLGLATKPSFLIDTRPVAGRIPLGVFSRLPGGLPKIAGFDLVGNVGVVLLPSDGAAPGAAAVDVHLRLPAFLTHGGVSFTTLVRLRATAAEGLVVDNLTIGPLNADIGALTVKALRLDYRRSANEWRGQGQACVVGVACLDMIPPNGSVVVKDGRLNFAGASISFPPPGITLFPGVSLERIGFGVGLDPTRLTGNARVSVIRLYTIDGRLFLAFPSAATPFAPYPREIGGSFPAALYGRTYTKPILGISADGYLRVPVIGDVKLGNGYLVYEYPGYVAFGGGTNQSFAKVISMEGSLAGELNFANGRFNIGGHVRACIIGVICRGATGVVSSRGLGACLEVGPLNIGGGVLYSPFSVKVWPLDGCRWSRFAEKQVRHVAVADSSAETVDTVDVVAGEPSRAIELAGATGAPRIQVTGPGGLTLSSSSGSGLATSGPIRIIRSEELKLTVVGLQDAPPGSYRIDTQPDSPPVATIGEASDPPAAKATATVTGSGASRVLHYDVQSRPDQQVTFAEVTAAGNVREIGGVDGGGSGTIPFAPAPGRGLSTVEAQFTLDELPAEKLTVARFTPPSPQLARPARLLVQRHGASLRATWAGVPGAARYEVVLTTGSDPQRLVVTRQTTITLPHVPKSSSGQVSVRAVDALRQGPPATAPFRASARLPSRFLPLG